MLAGPIGLLVILGVLAAVAVLTNRSRSSSARREESPSSGDRMSPTDHPFDLSSADRSHEDHHHHSMRDGDGDLSESDSTSLDGGWDSDGSSSDSADTGGSDGPSTDD